MVTEEVEIIQEVPTVVIARAQVVRVALTVAEVISHPHQVVIIHPEAAVEEADPVVQVL